MHYAEIVERHHIAGLQSKFNLKLWIADYESECPIGSINGFYQLRLDVKRSQERMVIANLEYIPLKVKGNDRRFTLDVATLILKSERQRRRSK